MELITILIIIFVVYKILDIIIRIPKIDKPLGRMKNILVTGCDTGFGNAFAKRMASKGFTVFAGCLTESGKTSLEDQYPEYLKPFLMDVTNELSVKKGYQYVCSLLTKNEGLWAIVNNAGITGISAPMEWLIKSDFNKTMDVNVYGMMQVTNTFAPLVKKTHGRIVNMCSIVGRYVLPYSSPYVVSKYAAEALSDSMRLELRPFDVSVHIIEPGFFATNLTDPERVNGSTKQCWDRLNPDMQEEYGEPFLKGAAATVSEILPIVGSSNLSLVVDCYDHAVTARYPRARYMPGLDSRYIYWFLRLLPEWLSDFMLSTAQTIKIPPPKGAAKYKI